MYTRPMIYKVYSIIVFVLACISFLSSIIVLLIPNDVFMNLPIQTKTTEPIILLMNIIKWSMIPSSIVSLFFSYVDFTSMFTFADMINYEKSGKAEPFRKRAFVFPARFYAKFGSVVSYIVIVISAISVIAMIIAYSISQKAFLAIPILRILPVILSVVLVYIIYYARFKAFGNLLSLLSKSEPDPLTLNDIKENKPALLRGYCNFLYVFVFVVLAVLVIAGFVMASTISAVIGVGATVLVYVFAFFTYVVYFIKLAITGCYFDNLAKMLEHYMIKYNLLNN